MKNYLIMSISDSEKEKEIAAIRQHYDQRKARAAATSSVSLYGQNVMKEREAVYARVLNGMGRPLSDLRIIEVGAGNGSNLLFFNKLGIPWENIVANELLEDRVEQLRKNCPEVQVIPGDALELPFQGEFDVVFQSTVFSSILSDTFRKQLAGKMWSMLKKGGIVLWYDFVYNNPTNPNVRKVNRKEVLELFPETATVELYPVTLAPPIGRRVGTAYGAINTLFPFLRSHLIAVLKK